MKSVRTSKWLAVVGLIAFGAQSASAMVINGDFETTDDTVGIRNGGVLSSLATGPGPSWDIYNAIPGWTATDSNGIEVQTNRTLGDIDAHSGLHYIELDTTDNSSMISSPINLTAGAYQFSFWYSPRSGRGPESLGISYSVFEDVDNGINPISGSITGPDTAPNVVGDWIQVTALFDVITDSNFRIFIAAEGNGDGIGGLIDTVSINAVPIPATGLLFPAALALLVFTTRERQSK